MKRYTLLYLTIIIETKKRIQNTIVGSLLLMMIFPLIAYNVKPPRLTVVLVVDQFAHSYVDKLYPHLKYGIRYLIDHGVNYTNAYWGNGQPGTATGHAGLNTGVNANYHGFVSNNWYEGTEKAACDDDDNQESLVLSPTGVYDYGKSAHKLMVDGLSDQCALQQEPGKAFAVYSISGKSRSAVATAGKLGKPLWIDPQTGNFTSSKAYFDQLPDWLQTFNENNPLDVLGSVTWKPMYPTSPYAYQFFNLDNYQYARGNKTMMNVSLPVPNESNPSNKYNLFEKTPYANKYILDCATACIKHHVSRKHKNRLLLWVCLSPLDKVAHQYGPGSREAVDMIYHLDKQIRQFMRKTLRIIGKHELMFALTAQQGDMPIPEILQEQGLGYAQRIDRIEFIKSLNETIHNKHAIENIVTNYKGQELVLNSSAFENVDDEKQRQVLSDIKWAALATPGIKNAWTYDELVNLPVEPHSLESNIKNQLFKGRAGSVIIQTYPYTVITHWPEGACHKTPYNYDTHVPLIIFHPGKFEKRYIRQRVSPLQLPNTIAEVLNVPKPSASTCEILPELFTVDYK
jgi:predicted AlkP superfamily pyrophosphatase or phosphodiesterase